MRIICGVMLQKSSRVNLRKQKYSLYRLGIFGSTGRKYGVLHTNMKQGIDVKYFKRNFIYFIV